MRLSRVYVPQGLKLDVVAPLTADLTRYLSRVLRLREGADIVAFDGSGPEYLSTVVSTAEGLGLLPRERLTPGRESKLHITLAIAVLRAERMDFAIQKAIELGASALEPIVTEYGVVQLDAKRAERRQQHWLGVVRSACEQSGRLTLPSIAPPVAFNDWLAGRPPAALEVALSPQGTIGFDSLLAETAEPTSSIRVTVGPEGGFAGGELDRLIDAGFRVARLGPRILRAETAATMAVGTAQLRCGDLDD
ncbi:MAG: 16S rRNA (uracil(1498)-N(3))-methyltransferase [Pseudomonadota bacterium]